ncbi:MAG: XRE family transcriptional regulator [Deltaproteobacteria bacterium]|nr:XRE family transcriptional regulator [Deltaproteobacteria bacterium]
MGCLSKPRPVGGDSTAVYSNNTVHQNGEKPLQELRQARKLSQEQMAKNLHTKQSNVSRIEKRTDMYISTLRGVIKAMGGDLEIVARFPDGNVRINQFVELDEAVKA